jgi:hypothetical protein
MAEMASETDPSSLMHAAFDDMDKTIDGILTDLGVAPEDPAFVHSDDYRSSKGCLESSFGPPSSDSFRSGQAG